MKKYVKVSSPHECRNFARLGALYWRVQDDDDDAEWILYQDEDYTYGMFYLSFNQLLDPATRNCDEAWQEQMDKYDASILVEGDEE